MNVFCDSRVWWGWKSGYGWSCGEWPGWCIMATCRLTSRVWLLPGIWVARCFQERTGIAVVPLAFLRKSIQVGFLAFRSPRSKYPGMFCMMPSISANEELIRRTEVSGYDEYLVTCQFYVCAIFVRWAWRWHEVSLLRLRCIALCCNTWQA